MFIIFTGNGKGKTTAAIGQAMRAVGNGSRVLMVQFIKGPWKSGEDKLAKKITPDFKIAKKGKGFVFKENDKIPFEDHVKAAKDALAYSAKEVERKVWNILILDEIWVALSLGLLTKESVSDFICKYLPKLDHLIMTGRYCPREFLERADLVTEMMEVKHPFSRGLIGARNIEY